MVRDLPLARVASSAFKKSKAPLVPAQVVSSHRKENSCATGIGVRPGATKSVSVERVESCVVNSPLPLWKVITLFIWPLPTVQDLPSFPWPDEVRCAHAQPDATSIPLRRSCLLLIQNCSGLVIAGSQSRYCSMRGNAITAREGRVRSDCPGQQMKLLR